MCEHMQMVKASSILYSEIGGGGGGESGSIVSNNEKYSPLLLKILSSY